MSSALPNAAATVYALADSLVRLRYRAEVTWCAEEPTDHLLARVDVCVGRALQSIEDLLASAEGAEVRAVGERLRDAITAAWGQFKQAWGRSQHQEVLDWWRQTEADYEHWKIPYALERSPLAGPAWQELEQVTGELRTALPGDLRTCFELSSLLAEEVYPTQERDRRVGELDVSELRYLTVNLGRQVKQAVAVLTVNLDRQVKQAGGEAAPATSGPVPCHAQPSSGRTRCGPGMGEGVRACLPGRRRDERAGHHV
jgi:hypothetical protein